eukprot:Seg11744.1 transcript_id=Seg11744.1/GoldUCD/mRNA.D3Y31 product="5-hydroxytryptamine receptor 5A" protein_id=Seg11744.1/GoldUCD/D3Y31
MKCETLHPNQNILSYANTYTLAVINILIGASNMVINSTIAYSIWRLKIHRSPSNRFILALSLSDCLVGVTVSPLIVILLLLRRQPFCMLEHFAQSLTFTVCQFTGIMVVIITLDRYLHMKHLTHYNSHMTQYRANILILLNVGSCLVTATSITLASIYGYIFHFEVCLVTVYSVFVLAIFVLYMKTFLDLKKRVNDMKSIRDVVLNRQTPVTQRRQKSEMIFAKGMIFVLTGTGLCYLPCFLAGTVWAYKKYVISHDPPAWLHSALFWACLLMYSNSTLNPIIMMTFNKRLRGQVFSLIKPGFMESSSENETIHSPTVTFPRSQAKVISSEDDPRKDVRM